MFRRRWPYGLTFMHIWQPAVIRRRYGLTFMHVSALAIIWTYVYACLSAGGDPDLRSPMSQRRRSYGLTPVHVRAPAGAEGEKA